MPFHSPFFLCSFFLDYFGYQTVVMFAMEIICTFSQEMCYYHKLVISNISYLVWYNTTQSNCVYKTNKINHEEKKVGIDNMTTSWSSFQSLNTISPNFKIIEDLSNLTTFVRRYRKKSTCKDQYSFIRFILKNTFSHYIDLTGLILAHIFFDNLGHS
jgi:hypothetical protein